ncbi:MAG: tetratricopeptide repeat protein [Cyclobacteriaceae bacterium]|nr:tetratricopeptide repeat protein [Cyclobacteriaceae bacterium]
MITFNKPIILLIFILLVSISNAQTIKIDSLVKALEARENDSIKCGTYYTLLNELMYDYPTQAVVYGHEYLLLAKKVNKSEQISAHNQLGISNYNLGFFNNAIQHFSSSIDLLDPQKDISKMARMLNNMAIIYDEMQQYEKALAYYRKSINTRIENNDDSTKLSGNFGNLGLAYLNLNDLDSAYKYISLSYKIDNQLKDSIGLLYSRSGMGLIYQKLKKYDSAKLYFDEVESITRTMKGQNNILCENYNNKGNLYMEMKEYQSAYESYNNAYPLAKKLQMGTNLLTSYEGLATSLKNLGRYNEAYVFLNKYTTLKDSLFTSDTRKQLNSAEIQQKELEINLLKQQGEIDNLELQQGKYILYFLIGIVFLVMVIAVIYYQKHNYKVNILKIVSQQRNDIAIKNKKILASIAYARGIQEAMFPPEEELKKVFKESFVFYKPSDVVTGDFYWLSKTKDGIILAVVDCEGHGVPGAFMTVMANSILNSVVNERGISSPSEILKELHVSIINTWNKYDENTLYNSGLDAIICNISLSSLKMTYSGAKRPLYHARNRLLNSFKGNCFSVGASYYQTDINYDEKELNLMKGDYIYMFTDGIVDQFGGEKNKKFLGKRLKSLLNKIGNESAESQHDQIDIEIKKWMSGTEQIDDMLLVGVKI